jgi:hypothetical protein
MRSVSLAHYENPKRPEQDVHGAPLCGGECDGVEADQSPSQDRPGTTLVPTQEASILLPAPE